jgi:hypothetical protein
MHTQADPGPRSETQGIQSLDRRSGPRRPRPSSGRAVAMTSRDQRHRAIVRSKLYLITVPGLEVKLDWRVVHDRLLDEFPAVVDVLATTMKGTILIVYEGPDDADAWLETVSETILNFRHAPAHGAPAVHATR